MSHRRRSGKKGLPWKFCGSIDFMSLHSKPKCDDIVAIARPDLGYNMRPARKKFPVHTAGLHESTNQSASLVVSDSLMELHTWLMLLVFVFFTLRAMWTSIVTLTSLGLPPACKILRAECIVNNETWQEKLKLESDISETKVQPFQCRQETSRPTKPSLKPEEAKLRNWQGSLTRNRAESTISPMVEVRSFHGIKQISSSGKHYLFGIYTMNISCFHITPGVSQLGPDNHFLSNHY